MIHNVPLWFVTCLFVTELIYYFINKLPEIVNGLLCLGLSAVGYLMITGEYAIDFTLLPWNIECAFVALAFYGIGNIFFKHIKHQSLINIVKKHSLIGSVLVVLSGVAVYFASSYRKCVNLAVDYLNGGAMYYLAGFVGIFMAILFSLLLSVLLEKCNAATSIFSKIYTKVCNHICYYGKNSFRFFATHNPVKGIVISVIAIIIDASVMSVHHSIYGFIAFIITLAVEEVLVYLINRYLIPLKKYKRKSCSNR